MSVQVVRPRYNAKGKTIRSSRIKGQKILLRIGKKGGRSNYKKHHAKIGDMQLSGKGPFPTQMFVQHEYSENFSLSSVNLATTFGTERVFTLNDLFDPDFSGFGHQPYGRDTLAAIYGRYKVYACKFEVEFTNPTIDDSCLGVMVTPTTDGTTLAGLDIAAAQEKYNVAWRMINNTGGATKKIGKYIKLQQIEGLSKLQWDADCVSYCAASGSSPTLQGHIRLALCNARGSATANMEVQVKLTYFCKWYNRQTLAQS